MTKKVYALRGYEDKGKNFRRSTDRDYTHAVLVTKKDGYQFVEGYCSRRDLADKLERAVYNRFSENLNELLSVQVIELIRIK
jgi:hypothetical protein